MSIARIKIGTLVLYAGVVLALGTFWVASLAWTQERKRDGDREGADKRTREEAGFSGNIQGIDLQKGTITVISRGDGGAETKTFSLASKDVKVATSHGKEVKLSDLPEGIRVFLKLRDQMDVIAIRIEFPTIFTVLAGVDPAKQTVALRLREGRGAPESLPVAKDAQIVLNGKEAKLKEVAAGQRAQIILSLDRREVQGIQIRSARRDEDRPKEGGRDGDRPKEGGRDGDRPKVGGRDGDRPKEGGRDGDRPKVGGRDGDRPKEGERRPDEGGRRPEEGREQPRGGTSGVIVDVDTAKQTLNLLIGREEMEIKTFKIAEDAKVHVCFYEKTVQETTLGQLGKALQANLHLGQDGKTVTRISITAPTLRGRLKNIDVGKRQLTVAPGREQPERILPIGVNARILIAAQEKTLTDLTAGMSLVLGLSLDRSQVLAIQAIPFRGDPERPRK